MSLSPYELVLIAGGFAILGAIIGGWIGLRNALRLYHIAEFNKATIEFKNAFLPEITFLRHNANIGDLGNSSDLGELLQFGYINRHLRAFEIFRGNLSSNVRKSIDQAWQEYCCHPDNPNVPFFEQYSWKAIGKGKSSEEELKRLALNRIKKILGFAKPK